MICQWQTESDLLILLADGREPVTWRKVPALSDVLAIRAIGVEMKECNVSIAE
jgi:hypothetical protein